LPGAANFSNEKAISAVERAGMRDLNEGQKIAYEIVADSAAANSRPTI
jgi:cold shock CspA family protein